jgi:LPXTG-motif cell wall-anchored protein
VLRRSRKTFAEDIRDIRGPIYILPEWVLAALIGSAALLALGIYFLWRRRRNRAARVLLPHELALQRLEDIGSLMQPARAREFSTAASDIVRQYIEQKFSVTATRRTTEEFLRDLLGSSDAALAQHQGLLGEFLHQCDIVKFAAQSLTQRNMESLRESARAFVLATVAAHDPLPAT